MSDSEYAAPLGWPSGSFSVVYADPPWSYRGRKQFGFAGDVGVDSGGAVMHYQTMPVADICALPVADLCAKDAILFLWIPSPLLPDGLTVASAWGFHYGTVAFVWHKQRTNPGYYTLSECELCFAFKRGRIPTPRSRKQRQFVSELRKRHSAKPQEVRNRIASMFPTQTKIELFYRGAPPEGWTVWGNEVDANAPAQGREAYPDAGGSRIGGDA